MSFIFAGVHRLRSLYSAIAPPKATKSSDALRMGLLGASNIAPIAAITPAASHPDIVISAVAARNKQKAEKYAKRHGIPRVLDSYEALIADPNVDVIYNGLPNGLHLEWTLKAIAAGKHVLLEKPSASNEQEARQIFESAREKGVVVLEAFHYRFHPALHEFAYQVYSVVNPQNPLVSMEAGLFMPPLPAFIEAPLSSETDIRLDYTVAGGALMDMGCYTISSTLYGVRVAGGTEKRENWQSGIEVEKADPVLFVPKSNETLESGHHLDKAGKPAIDQSMHATFLVPTARPQKIPCTITCDFAPKSSLFGLKIPALKIPFLMATCKDGTTVRYDNFVAPFIWHSIDTQFGARAAQQANVKEGSVKTSKAYTSGDHSGTEQMIRAAKDGHWPAETGEEWWSTYRWQLEAFVTGVRAAQSGVPAPDVHSHVPVWVQNEESIVFMQIIDSIYRKAGLALRGV